jgi:PAS domain S-box-containing protein
MERALELQTQLTSLEEKHRALLEHIPATLVAVLDRDLRYVHVNQTVATLGWKAEDLVGRTVDDVLHDRPEVCELHRAALAGESQSFDYLSLNGERNFSLQILPLRGSRRSSV